ncbi:hypothetical protein CPB86DRAFT_787658 [Serendipita vermifera]|nr:hypothetical protein CPB86DRAFT_787658 [Serendipita vermifera]
MSFSTITGSRKQRESVLSQQSSLYPPSTVTSNSAFSGPETPPEHLSEPPPLDVDDVSYRLKLLVKNNYFLPPPHVKPNVQPLSAATPTTPVKPPTLRALFRPSKSPKVQSVPQIPQVTPPKPRNVKPQNRVVVIREKLTDLCPEPLPQFDDFLNRVEENVDPTTAVDVEQPLPPPQLHPHPVRAASVPSFPDWRKDLLQQAVGLSFVNPPERKQSLPIIDPSIRIGQSITAAAAASASASVSASVPVSASAAAVNNTATTTTITTATTSAATSISSPMRDSWPTRPVESHATALKPPPRPTRDRSRGADDSTSVSESISYKTSVRNSDPAPEMNEMRVLPRLSDVHSEGHGMAPSMRPSFAQASRPSLSRSLPHSMSPFGQPMPTSRFSSATEHTQSTSTLHLDEQDLALFRASRPSLTASSVHSLPRPSISESHVSHYSNTFGERVGESNARTSVRTRARSSSLAYLRGKSRSRSRSVSPSRTNTSLPPPPIPPLPTTANSSTDGHGTVIYIHPKGGLSNSALGNPTSSSVHLASPQDPTSSPLLDPRRGITNCPVPSSPSSPRFLGLKSPKTSVPVPVDVQLLLDNGQLDAPDEEAYRYAGVSVADSWRNAQAYQDEVRKFEGMVVQHIESEKDRFKQIAIRGRTEKTD